MSKFLQKIQMNYQKNILEYDNDSKSKYWEKSVLKKKNLFNLIKIKNFRYNNLSKNIDDFYINNFEAKRLYDNLILECKNNYIKKFLFSNNIGNAKKIFKNKKEIITSSDLFHIKYIHELEKKINLKKINTICEIGQGFGLLASKLLKIKNYKIILIDLPESNFITLFFLKNLFPKKKIYMDIDMPKKKLTKEIFFKGDIFVISPWTKIDNFKIDFFINSRSMMEMNFGSIENYFQMIHKKINKNGHFLCINRYYKDLVGYPIELHRYPFQNVWKTIISKSAWMQPHIHYLLVKKTYKKNSDIKKTLAIIEKKYLRLVKNDKIVIRRILPVQIYRYYKLLKHFILNNFK